MGMLTADVWQIREAPVKTKLCQIDGVKTQIQPRSFSTSAMPPEESK
jgi:hypothetical protein